MQHHKTIHPAKVTAPNYPTRAAGNKRGAVCFCTAPLNNHSSDSNSGLAATITPRIIFLMYSCLSCPSGTRVSNIAHSSGVKATMRAMWPGFEEGSIIFSIAACILCGMGLCTLPSHPSTVRGLMCNIAASSAREVPDKASHVCNRLLSIQADYTQLCAKSKEQTAQKLRIA